MSRLLARNITRVLLNDDEETQKLSDANANPLTFVIGAADAVFIGFTEKFSSRHFQMGTVNSNTITVSVAFFDGTDFSNSVDDLVDQTDGFKQTGFISWVNKSEWEEVALKDVVPSVDFDIDIKLFWIKLTVSGSLSGGTTLQSILNLFCDDELVRAYYPYLIADSRWLPEGRTTFLDQYKAAKDLVVLRLKQMRQIQFEGNIIDTNAVSVACVHAAAWIIVNPIAFSDEDKDLAGRALDQFNREIKQVNLNIDIDQDGVIDDFERERVGTSRFIRT